MRKNIWKLALAGAFAGSLNGLFGAGGGMVLVPLLSSVTDPEKEDVFACSVCILLSISLVSVAVTAGQWGPALRDGLRYLIGSGLGGYLAGKYCGRIPLLWLHRALGVMILWGGIRYLC